MMELGSQSIHDGQTWITIKDGKDFVVIHIKNAEAKKIDLKGTNLNIEV